MEYLTEQEYYEQTGKIGTGHWSKQVDARWLYHAKAVEFVKMAKPRSARDVLEMGTMGVSIVKGSDTIDYTKKWNVKGFTPTYIHDARQFPWPVRNKQYDVFVALRVFHHLIPVQRECFLEAKRIARNIVISVPEKTKPGKPREGIPYEQFVEWNNGKPPSAHIDLKNWVGSVFFWNEEALS